MKKFLLRLIIIFLAILTLYSCVEKNESNVNGKLEDTFVVTTSYFPKDLNNAQLNDSNASELSYMLFDGLVKYDINGTIIPSLCKSWSVLNSGLKYKFLLKDNLYFSNGNSIDADVIKDFFLSFFKSDLVDFKYKTMLEPIFGVKDYFQTGNINNIAINVIDSKTLEFNLNNTNSSFLQILSNPVFFLRDLNYCDENWINNYNIMAYSGPYKIKDINNNKVTLIKNYNYKGKYSINKKEIIYEKTISEHAMAMFDLNAVDAMLDVPESEINRLNNDQYLNKINTETVYTLNFNLKNEDVKNKELRKAIIESIEQEKNGDLTFKSLNYNLGFIEEDIDKPSADSSDENNINEIKSLNILLKDTNDSNSFIELLKKILKSHYNIDLNIKYFDNDEELLNSNYQVAILEISPNFLDELSFLQNWKSDSKQNYFGFKNEEFDKNLDKAIESMDNVEQIKNCQDILKDNYITTILGYEDKVICIKNQNNNLFIDRMGILRFDL